MGSFNGSCDVVSGQCYCKPGVSGLKCDQCMSHYYGFTDSGCSGNIFSRLREIRFKSYSVIYVERT